MHRLSVACSAQYASRDVRRGAGICFPVRNACLLSLQRRPAEEEGGEEEEEEAPPPPKWRAPPPRPAQKKPKHEVRHGKVQGSARELCMPRVHRQRQESLRTLCREALLGSVRCSLPRRRRRTRPCRSPHTRSTDPRRAPHNSLTPPNNAGPR